MARVVVIGGGYGGLASAVRLAKIGHDVTLLEAGARLGGALGHIEKDGFRWDAGPTHTLLPAVLRDLFRKSGRALEKEIELVPVEPMARHVFDDDTVLDLPGGSRAAQIEAVDRDLGAGLGAQWAAYVDTFADDWEALRRDWLERPYSADHASRHAKALLSTRLTLSKLTAKALKDERLRQVARYPMTLEGHDLRNVPAWMGMWTYVEQNFGSWTVPGGMGSLADALTSRLATRGVVVLLDTAALDLELSGGRVAGVRTAHGPIPADHVVCAVDPRRLPALAPLVARTMPVIPPVISHLGIVGEVPDLPHEVVLHGDPMMVVRTGGHAPPGAHAWTVLGRGSLDRGHRHRHAPHRRAGARPGGGPRRPVSARAGGAGRLAVRRAVAGAQHGHPTAGAHDPGPRRLPGRRARDSRRWVALRGALCGPGGPVDRPSLTRRGAPR